MKFKETYRGEDPNLSLGRFYNTDIRKLAAFQLDYPKLFADEVGDPRIFYTDRVRAQNTIFFSMKTRKKVVMYGAFDPIGAELATMHCWRRKWERTRRHCIVGLMRLLAEFGFKELSLRRVTITAAGFAEAAMRVIKETGFTHEGTLRKFAKYQSIPEDIHIFGMLKEEF